MPINIFTVLFENGGNKFMQMVSADNLGQAQEKARQELVKSVGIIAGNFAITMSSVVTIEIPKVEQQPINEIQQTVSKILLQNVSDKQTAKTMLEYIGSEYCNDVDKQSLLRISKRLL